MLKRCLQCRRRLARVFRALCERLKRNEDRARVGSIGEGRAGEADKVDGVGDPRHLQGRFHDTPIDVIGPRKRGAARQLRHDDEVALIDLRDEPDRRLAELVESKQDHAGIDDQHQHGKAHDPPR